LRRVAEGQQALKPLRDRKQTFITIRGALTGASNSANMRSIFDFSVVNVKIADRLAGEWIRTLDSACLAREGPIFSIFLSPWRTR
jgi:hypothetical protein